MAIKQTELVTINGSSEIYGGRIYSVNYNIGVNESPSTLTVNIINSSGNYSITKGDLDVTGSADTISLGNSRDIKMILVEYAIDKGEGGKILSLQYVDPSLVFLDKKFVVLKDIHTREVSNNSSSALITVGRKYYSNTYEDSNGAYIEELTTIPPNNRDLGQSFYRVSELYSAMEAHGIPMDESVLDVLSSKDGYNDYLNNIVGQLRSVLLAWANIMAFAFYWGEDNKLHFVDLKDDLNVNTEKLKDVVPFSEQETWSLRDTVSRGYSLYYGKAGYLESNQNPLITTNITFNRGVRNLNEEINFQNAEPFIKAALLGEDFFRLYALQACFNNESLREWLGYDEIVQLTADQKNLIRNEDDYPESEWNFIKFTARDNIKYNYQFFYNFAQKLLTYEEVMRISTYTKYTNWTRSFSIDVENETEFLDPLNGQNLIGPSNHRVFFVLPIEEAFDLSSTIDLPNEFSREVDYEVGFGQPLPIYNLDLVNDNVLAYRLNYQYDQIVAGIKYKYKNKKFLPVRGYKDISGQQTSVPRSEKIFLEKPDFSSNTVNIDMQLDTTDDNKISLAEQAGTSTPFINLANILNESYLRTSKTYKKTFSVTNIDLPEKLTPLDGLQSISIANSNSKGTETTYTVGNTYLKIPSREVVLQKLQKEKVAYLRQIPRGTFVLTRGGLNN